jgi:selenoprotein W-related protein
MQRAGWTAMELLTTFNEGKLLIRHFCPKKHNFIRFCPHFTGQIKVTLVPNHVRPGGVFTVRVDGTVVYDRKSQAPPRFPEMKELKQLVRDIVQPDRGLGHSDKKGTGGK